MAIDGPRAGRREWIGLGVLALPCVLYSMDLTVLNLAVPSLAADLAPSGTQLLWIVDIYGFLVAGSLITMGTLGDRIGRRKLLLIGAAAFGAASVLAAFATSANALIAARAVLGIAGATLAPSTLSLIRNMFLDPAERTLAIGVWVSSYSAGAAIGPLIGGAVLEYFWWGAVFLIGVPVMALLLVVGPVLLPEFRDPQAGKLDLPSALLSLACVLTGIYGLKHIAQHGATWTPLPWLALSLVLARVFTMRQRRLADPLIDVRLFSSRVFSVSLAAYAITSFVALGSFVFVAQYLQLVLGLSPLHAGLWTMPFALGFIVGSMATPALTRRAPAHLVIGGGLVLSAIGFALLALVEGPAALAMVVTATVLYSIGMAPAVTLANDAIVASAPAERAGAAAALSETGAELGGALGIALLGSIGTAVYRGVMLDRTPPEIATTATDTLAGALIAAEQLPEPIGSALLTLARDAFTQSMSVTAVISATIVLATALLVMRELPAEKPASD